MNEDEGEDYDDEVEVNEGEGDETTVVFLTNDERQRFKTMGEKNLKDILKAKKEEEGKRKGRRKEEGGEKKRKRGGRERRKKTKKNQTIPTGLLLVNLGFSMCPFYWSEVCQLSFLREN